MNIKILVIFIESFTSILFLKKVCIFLGVMSLQFLSGSPSSFYYSLLLYIDVCFFIFRGLYILEKNKKLCIKCVCVCVFTTCILKYRSLLKKLLYCDNCYRGSFYVIYAYLDYFAPIINIRSLMFYDNFL